MSSSITGRDMISMMTEGVEAHAKKYIVDTLVTRLTEEFKANIQEEIEEILADMVLQAHSSRNQMEMSDNINLLIKWVKDTPEYERKYSMVSTTQEI